ncbi:MAG: phenylacetate--CoA ligase family protein [Candidatus Aenigmarchaeota archaeon]|nr:phenylacetate--CoA ligase family protein [Candidatus Aenigmarchaeota archaeon]
MLYEFALQKIAFPVSNALMGRKFWRYYGELSKSQWLKREELEEMQLKKLKILVSHAYLTVPLYREMMDRKKVKPSDIQKLKDIRKLPIVTKKDFRAGFPERSVSSAVPPKKRMFDSTSGSTGSPFQFVRDINFSDYSLANTYRTYNWTGMKIGNKTVSLWGAHKVSPVIKVFDAMMRRKYLSSFDVEENYREYYKELKRYRPYLIEAYSASVTHLAKLLKEDGLTGLQIPAVISSAETLYPKNRKLIEEVLHTKVFNRYGSREVGNVAHECEEHTGLHINAESYIVEIIPEKGSKGKGRLIVTNLTNFAMPFIRYDTEDYATPSGKECSCGRGLPLIANIEGRVTDFIILPNGKDLSYLFFNYFFEQYGAYLLQFQVIQDKKDHLLLKVVPTSKYSKKTEAEILKGLGKKLGQNMKITVEKARSIEKEKSGKIRPVKRLI